MAPEQMERPVGERHKFSGMEHYVEGYNFRLDAIQAIIVNAKFARLDEWRSLREAVANRYAVLLAGVPGVGLPYVPAHIRPSWRNYVIRVPQRDRVQKRMLEQRITVASFYSPPVHLQPVYRSLGLGPGSFPHAESAAASILCLPMHPGLTEDVQDRVAETLIRTVREVQG
jgi:dTDP-4-amino-4,6-dideoxygalactose transaminase